MHLLELITKAVQELPGKSEAAKTAAEAGVVKV